MNPRDSFIYNIFTNWHTRERLHYQNILVFRQKRKKKIRKTSWPDDSQNIITLQWRALGKGHTGFLL